MVASRPMDSFTVSLVSALRWSAGRRRLSALPMSTAPTTHPNMTRDMISVFIALFSQRFHST